MNIGAASIFIIILVLGLFVNKYVLSVLGFKYPTIFQVKVKVIFSVFFRIWTTYSHSLSILKSNNFKLKMIKGWQTLCGLLLYKILTVTGKSNFKVICRKQKIKEVLAA